MMPSSNQRVYSRFIPSEEVGDVTHWKFGAMDGSDLEEPVPESEAAAGQGQSDGKATARAALPRPWTSFNNCTARITRELVRELVPPSPHFKEDWCKPEMVAQFRALRARQATEAWH